MQQCAVIVKTFEKGIFKSPIIHKDTKTANDAFLQEIIKSINDVTEHRCFPEYIKKYAKLKNQQIDAKQIIENNLIYDFLDFMTQNYSCIFDKDKQYFAVKSGCKRLEISMHIVTPH